MSQRVTNEEIVAELEAIRNPSTPWRTRYTPNAGKVEVIEEGQHTRATHRWLRLNDHCHAIYNMALYRGILVRPDTCERCGKKHDNIHGHHPDYYRPIDVEWLCQPCHIREHSSG